ncbi:hypothetical protein AVEN_45208-1, partial [Araneus ventricosus]
GPRHRPPRSNKEGTPALGILLALTLVLVEPIRSGHPGDSDHPNAKPQRVTFA